MTTQDTHEFDYLAEKAKIEFQANIGSLLEMHSLLSARLSDAIQRNKEGIFLTAGEAEVYKDWLMQTSTSLLENYALIDRANRVTNKLYRISKIAEPKKQKAA